MSFPIVGFSPIMVGSVLMAVGLVLDLLGVSVIYYGARISGGRLRKIRDEFDKAAGVWGDAGGIEALLEDREDQARKAKHGTLLLGIGFGFQLVGSLLLA